MWRETITDLAIDRRREVLALVALVNFGLAFALATTIDAGAMIRASALVVAFVVSTSGEYVLVRRWCEPCVRSFVYRTG